MSERNNTAVKLPHRAVQLVGEKLPGNVTVLMVPPEMLPPEFVRLPEGGEDERCPVTGMSRTWVIERIKESQGTKCAIKAHHLRTRGATRGTVLIDRASLVAFVESFPAPRWASADDADGEDGETRRRGQKKKGAKS